VEFRVPIFVNCVTFFAWLSPMGKLQPTTGRLYLAFQPINQVNSAMTLLQRFVIPLLLTFCLGILTPASASASEDVARGKVVGGVPHSAPNWFKESFLEIADDVDEASEAGKHVLLFFELNGCPYCDRMLRESFETDPVSSYIQANFDVIAINIQGDREIAFNEEISVSEKKLGEMLKVYSTPALVFLDENNSTCLPASLASSTSSTISRKLSLNQSGTECCTPPTTLPRATSSLALALAGVRMPRQKVNSSGITNRCNKVIAELTWVMGWKVKYNCLVVGCNFPIGNSPAKAVMQFTKKDAKNATCYTSFLLFMKGFLPCL
jgi:thioredoxin-related protein